MGVLARSRKNLCIAQGLVPGATIHLEAVVKGTTRRHITRIEAVTEQSISVLVALEQLQARPLASGVNVAGRYVHRSQTWNFTSKVTGHSPDGLYDLLSLPEDASCDEQRRYFRLAMVLPAKRVYRFLPATEHLNEEVGKELEAVIFDLSEGGMQLGTRAEINVGDVLGLETTLPNGGEIEARMEALRVRAPSRQRREYRGAFRFTSIKASHKQRIAQYLMSRQLEMARKGQL